MKKVLLFALAVTVMTAAMVPLVRAQPAAPKTASQVFLEYRAAFEKAKAVEEIMPFQDKATRAQIEKTPAAERKQMFEMMQIMSDARDVKVVKETRNDKGVELTVEGTTPDKKKSTGKIQMVQEGGAWKVAGENWE
jgi:hypothetical protein